MKGRALVVSFVLLSFGTSAYAQGNDSAYVKALDHLSDKCTIIAYRAGLESATTGTITPESEKVGLCIRDAKMQATEIYKSYVAKVDNRQIKNDMKSVYVAWLVYFPERVAYAMEHHDATVDNSIASNAYKKAVSTLQVDKLTE